MAALAWPLLAYVRGRKPSLHLSRVVKKAQKLSRCKCRMQTASDDNANHRGQREVGTEVLKGGGGAKYSIYREEVGAAVEETPPRRDQGCKVAPMTQSPAAASGDI